MGDFLGLAAGIGMLLLIGLILFAFLRQLHWISDEKAKSVLRCALMCLGMGTCYYLGAALLCAIQLRELHSAVRLSEVFTGEKIQIVLDALDHPVWTGPLSGLFVYAARLLGKVFFSQYQFAGVAFSFLLSTVACCMVYFASLSFFDEKTAQNTAFLSLCLPGSVFFFLPGAGPILYAFIGLALLLLSKLLKVRRNGSLPFYNVILSFSMLLSSFVTAGCVNGWLG